MPHITDLEQDCEWGGVMKWKIKCQETAQVYTSPESTVYTLTSSLGTRSSDIKLNNHRPDKGLKGTVENWTFLFINEGHLKSIQGVKHFESYAKVMLN